MGSNPVAVTRSTISFSVSKTYLIFLIAAIDSTKDQNLYVELFNDSQGKTCASLVDSTINHWNIRLTAADVFHMFTQSIKFF